MLAYVRTLQERNAMSDIGGGGIGPKSTFRLCFIVLIAKAFNCAHKQQQETGIRDLGHYAALLPVVVGLRQTVTRCNPHGTTLPSRKLQAARD